MPVPVDGRPPSQTANGATPARMTTTSRRGGRSSARSPAVGSSSNHNNPSSAAAAAAAAAKAITKGGGWDRRADYDKNVQQHPYHWAQHDDRRYYERYAREDPYRYGDPRMRVHPDSRYQYPQGYHRHAARDPPQHQQQRQARSGTNLVIGGPKPIHVPKPSEYPKKTEHALKRSAVASVFRGKPVEEKPPGGDRARDSSPKLLLSLRTPSSSEEKNGVLTSKKESLKTHSRRSSDPLDLQKTPGDSDKSDSFGLAPSFNIFNQSFDSLGDVQLNVDSTLNADSFGLLHTSSLAHDASNQQLLEDKDVKDPIAGVGNGMTIGYSSVTNYGAPGPEDTMLLDASDPAASSPTQVLNMYGSYSGHRSGPLDDSHLRMSIGSFGGNSRFSGPYDGMGSPGYYYGPGGSHESVERDFYAFLRKYKDAFRDCTFILPGLKETLLRNNVAVEELVGSSVEKSDSGSSKFGASNGVPMYPDPTKDDIAVARRRVESSVCAFGGNLNLGQSSLAIKVSPSTEEKKEEVATVTPSSSTTSPPRSSKRKYDESLANRYYENESRLSWEFEETPPIEGLDGAMSKVSVGRNGGRSDESGDGFAEKGKAEDIEAYCQPIRAGEDEVSFAGSVSTQQKMKYRCKLCGKPKQNHVCKYEQSLARSIGVMVYPCVNAFTAAEPGTVAPPLSDMNNFTDQKDLALNSSPGRSPDRSRSSASVASNKQVTPDSLRSLGVSHATAPIQPDLEPRGSSKRRRYAGRGGDNDSLFTESTALRPEQTCSVSGEVVHSEDAFKYPALPMPYAQRKRLSDNLFSLSNEVPKLTDECAKVLREAREKDMWDLAVAELMTQVVVVLHCRDGDHRFEGLRQYLLTLGIAC